MIRARTVHVDADVPLVGDGRLPGVQPDPDRHRPAPQRLLDVRGCGDGIGRSRKGDEEGVALRVDLDPPMGSDHLPHDLAVRDEHVGVPIAELVQEPRRTLDVREHERHGSTREVARHPARLTAPVAGGQGAEARELIAPTARQRLSMRAQTLSRIAASAPVVRQCESMRARTLSRIAPTFLQSMTVPRS